jgi:exopolysaccharide biosynthesis polyprenyl glycosylphosphotransferase
MNMSASESVTSRLYAENLATSPKRLGAASTRFFRSGLACVEVTADLLTCVLSIFFAYFLDLSLHLRGQAQYPAREAAAVSIVIGLFVGLHLQRDGAYQGGGSLLHLRETERALRIPVQSVLLLLPFSFLLHLRFSGAPFLIALVLIPVLLVLQKQALFSLVRVLHAGGYGIDRVAVYGAGDAARRIVSALSHSLGLGLCTVALIDDNPALDGSGMLELGYRRRRSVVPVQRGPVTPELLESCQCSLLIVALPNLSSRRVAEAVDAAAQAGLKVALLSGAELPKQQWTKSLDIDGLSLTPLTEPVGSWHYALVKRMVDLIGSSLLLVLFAPLLFLVALLVKLETLGPALFIQNRVGRHGELFRMYKFRSMYTNAPKYDFSPITSHDPRITRIGRFLRRTSLDELPQLMNVFLGDMSLVGPRPEMPFIVRDYTSEHRQRLQVMPGITGLWQLSADRSFQIHDNMEYDLYYIRNRGFFMDIAILIHTLFFAMRSGV